MPVDDTLPKSLQESILAALIFSKELGSAITVQVQPSHFDNIYRTIVGKVLDYRRKYNLPPGTDHIDDILSSELANRDRGTWLRRLLGSLLDLAEHLNEDYVKTRTGEFIRQQELKAAILTASERYTQGGEALVEDVERILNTALRTRAEVLEPGLYLNNTERLLNFFDNRSVPYPIGINQLDQLGIGAVPKELLLYIGPKGTGKTWFCVHMAKQGLMHRAKVLHITLEVGEEILAGRYCQALFAAGWEATYEAAHLEFDELKRLTSWKVGRRHPTINLSSPDARTKLKAKIKPWGLRFGRVLIKEFPSSRLTVSQLEAFLDYLENVEKFIPTLLIIDSPYLMKLDTRNLRLDLSRTVIELRGLGMARGLAVVATHQSQRGGIKARHVRSTNAAEAIDVVFTADNVLTYSQTAAEEKYGLGRLAVEHARNRRTGTQVLLVHGYSVGQYVLDSALVTPQYWRHLKSLGNDEGDEDDTES